jgi:ATP synthase protein I
MRHAQPVVRARSKASKIVMAQIAIVVIFALIAWGAYSAETALSVILGGLACVLPSAYFARRFFFSTDARAAKQIIRSFYIGEMIKLLLTGILVIVFVRYFPVSLLPFFVGFAGAQFGFWLAPMLGV